MREKFTIDPAYNVSLPLLGACDPIDQMMLKVYDRNSIDTSLDGMNTR